MPREDEGFPRQLSMRRRFVWAMSFGNVEVVLAAFETARAATEAAFTKAVELNDLGLKDMDALHLSFAGILKAQCFLTCADDLLRKAYRLDLPVKIMSTVAFVEALNM